MALFKLQRLLAEGHGTLPRTCIMDVGAIARWLHSAIDPRQISINWAALVSGTTQSPRRLIWLAAMPGRTPSVFGPAELNGAVAQLGQLGVHPIVPSAEPPTSLFAPEWSVEAGGAPLPLLERVAVVGAEVDEYPEQLFVLEGDVSALLDLATGRVHTPWSELRDGRPEPAFIPLRQAQIVPDPSDARKRPPAGNAAARYAREFDRIYQGSAHPEAGKTPEPSLPKYTLDSIWKNLGRIPERTREIVGTGRDEYARVALEAALQPASNQLPAMPQATPIVVVPLLNGNGGELKLAGNGFVLLGRSRREATDELAVKTMLQELVKNYPATWVAPRALDLLGYMSDRGIALPEAVVDPAHCAFLLCPDSIDDALGTCVSQALVPRAAAIWMWDVTRKAPPPQDLQDLAPVLPQLVDELRRNLTARGLAALMDDDIAKTLPVLAAMERRGAWIRDDARGTGSFLQTEMGLMETQFRTLVGDVAPYEATPEELLYMLNRHGVTLPSDRRLEGIKPKNELERLAAVDTRVDALLKARTLSNVQSWMLRLDEAGGRLRGHHFPQATGRWGMNAHPLQAIPKRSRGAKAMRARLEGPEGMWLVSADFSSYEFRLAAGLSRDPSLLAAAQQMDAIDHFARGYFGSSYTAARRAEMKRYLHPINYGAGEWGFVSEQVAMPVADAVNHYQRLHQSLSPLFSWRAHVTALAQQSGFVQTQGGWQRELGSAGATRSHHRRTHWLDNMIVSTLVQGLAADILRWCLRELNRSLPALGAQLVFQNHDEIYVAAKKAHVAQVQAAVKDVLEQRVRHSGLVPPGVRLVANIKNGTTWADLI